MVNTISVVTRAGAGEVVQVQVAAGTRYPGRQFVGFKKDKIFFFFF